MIFATCSSELPRPSAPMASCAGQAIFLSATMIGPGSQPVQRLLDDLQRLAHLVQPHLVPAPDVAGRRGRRRRTRRSRSRSTAWSCAGPRPRPAERSTGPVTPSARQPVDVQHRDALGALVPDDLAGEQVLVLLELLRHVLEEVADLRDRRRPGTSCATPPGRMYAMFIRRPVIILEDVQDVLALAEAVQHHRDRAELHAGGAEPDQVRGDPVELHHQHADRGGPLGDLVLDAEQLLHRRGSTPSR